MCRRASRKKLRVNLAVDIRNKRVLYGIGAEKAMKMSMGSKSMRTTKRAYHKAALRPIEAGLLTLRMIAFETEG